MNHMHSLVVVLPHTTTSSQVLEPADAWFHQEQLCLTGADLQLLRQRGLPEPEVVQFFRGALRAHHLTSSFYNKMFANVMRGVKRASLFQV